jgi:acetyl-CoA C-acetyltransferase
MSLDYRNFPEPQLHPTVRPRRKSSDTEVVIVAAARTPIGRFQGSLSEVAAPKLGATAIKAVLERSKVDPSLIDEVIMGCVLTAGVGQNPARQAALGAGLPPTVSALTINKVCASGLKSVALASQAIRAGDFEAVIAGGMENMSRSPYILDKARSGYRLGHGQLIDSMIADGLWDAYSQFHMGNTGELVAQRYNFSRQDQDEYALASHQKALAAIQAGAFVNEICPVEVPAGKGKTALFSVDECPRSDTSSETLAKLRPAFLEGGTVTAGNAPGCNDGAGAVLVTSREFAERHKLPILATVLDHFAGGLDPAWVMLTPIPSVRGLLARNPEWSINDFAAFEINEAFSVQALAVVKDLEIPAEKVNINGGAVALGHPIGASGSRILVTLIHALQAKGGGRGIATLCLGGGNGLALAIEVAG